MIQPKKRLATGANKGGLSERLRVNYLARQGPLPLFIYVGVDLRIKGQKKKLHEKICFDLKHNAKGTTEPKH